MPSQHTPITGPYTHFLTCTVVDWVDIFTRPIYKNIIADSLNHCSKHKGLNIIAWCLMTNHLHLICYADDGIRLSDIIRDFKKFTSKKLVDAIEETPESRKDWLLDKFHFLGKVNRKNWYQKVWRDGNAAKEIHSPEFLYQKIDYVHQNPVRAGIVWKPEEYMYSSANDYAGEKGLVDVIVAY